jgi:hypothetical protein
LAPEGDLVADPTSLWDSAKVFVSPAIGIVGGWVTAAWKSTNRVTILEKTVADLLKKQAEDSVRYAADLKSLKQDLEKKHEDLREDVKELDDAFDKFARESASDFANNEQFQRFIEEWQKQCLKIQRTLGQIEGMLHRETMILPKQTREG